jgi:hypothetical protein
VSDNAKPQHVNAAPSNSVEIRKTGWTPERYQQWFSSLETRATPSTTAQDLFEIQHTGPLNYLLKGGGVGFWADGISDRRVLEAKMVVNPKKSPFIHGAGADTPPFIRDRMIDDVRSEMSRIGPILRDEGNPLESLRIITKQPGRKALLRGIDARMPHPR